MKLLRLANDFLVDFFVASWTEALGALTSRLKGFSSPSLLNGSVFYFLFTTLGLINTDLVV